MGYGRIWGHEMTRRRLFDPHPRADDDDDDDDAAAGRSRCIGGQANITV